MEKQTDFSPKAVMDRYLEAISGISSRPRTPQSPETFSHLLWRRESHVGISRNDFLNAALLGSCPARIADEKDPPPSPEGILSGEPVSVTVNKYFGDEGRSRVFGKVMRTSIERIAAKLLDNLRRKVIAICPGNRNSSFEIFNPTQGRGVEIVAWPATEESILCWAAEWSDNDYHVDKLDFLMTVAMEVRETPLSPAGQFSDDLEYETRKLFRYITGKPCSWDCKRLAWRIDKTWLR